MEDTRVAISVNELKKTLSAIFESDLGVQIRFRTLGHLWYPNFVRILKIENGQGILFFDEGQNFFISLRDLSAITEFEIDTGLYPLEPNYHYQVTGIDAKLI